MTTEKRHTTVTKITNPVSAESVSALASRLRGKLIRPDSPLYTKACAIWNGMIEKRPAFVVQPQGAADVIECVNFARNENVPLSVRGGGHNIAGSALVDGGLMIDNTPRKGIHVDVPRGVVRMEPGVTWGDADRETQLYGLAVPGGIISDTGVAGFTLGGGFGYASRKYGLASDNLLSVDIVTAEGTLIRASKTEHPDLFWALRGGGGNFGIVTSFEFQTNQIGPEVVAGMALFPMEMANQVIDLYRSITGSASDEFCCGLVIRLAPPAPFLPKEVHGTPVIGLITCHIGSITEGERAVQPIRDLGGALADLISPKRYTDHQNMLDSGQPFGRRYYWKSDYFPAIDPGMDEVMLKHIGKMKSPHSALLALHLGGETNRTGETDTAAGNRDAEFIIGIQSQWENETEDEEHISWTREFSDALKPYGTGGTYVNFLTDDTKEDRLREAYRSTNYDRLAKVKAKYDPENMFRSNQNILPSK